MNLERFDALPRGVREAVVRHLFDAMRWRGWDAIRTLRGGYPCNCHAREEVRAIADLLSANGCEIEEYT